MGIPNKDVRYALRPQVKGTDHPRIRPGCVIVPRMVFKDYESQTATSRCAGGLPPHNVFIHQTAALHPECQ